MADYVLKPAERERLQVTADRIRKRLAARGTPEESAAPPPPLPPAPPRRPQGKA